MSVTPFLSVVIPTFNRKESLRRTLEGLARQDYPADRFEVVVVSDGSTDGTEAFLEEYARKTPFVLRPIRQANAGPARARNHGVQEARGQVIVFIDDDIEPASGFLSAHARHHESDDKVVVIGPQNRDPALRRREPVWIVWEHTMLEKQYEAWRTGLWPGAGPNHFYTGNASLRRVHLLAVGGFDETFKRLEDVEIAYRMEQECGTRYLFDPETVAVHRPTRTFGSWIRTPYAYGRMDVIQAHRGHLPWALLQGHYRSRNRLTRLLSDAALPCPPVGAAARALLRWAAQLLYYVPGRLAERLALSALSAAYNLRYVEGIRDELGSWPAMRAKLALSEERTPCPGDGS